MCGHMCLHAALPPRTCSDHTTSMTRWLPRTQVRGLEKLGANAKIDLRPCLVGSGACAVARRRSNARCNGVQNGGPQGGGARGGGTRGGGASAHISLFLGGLPKDR